MNVRLKKLVRKLTQLNGDRRWTYWSMLLIWIPAMSALLCVLLWSRKPFFKQFALSWAIGSIVMNVCRSGHWMVCEGESLAFRVFSKRAPQHSRLWHFAVSFLFIVPGIYVAFNILDLFAPSLGLVAGATAEDYRFGILFGMAISFLFFLVRTRTDYKEAAQASELRMKKIENERLQAQLSALTAQMNPHMLFNSLNTVASLVKSDPDKAEETILRLSQLYRGVLESSRKRSHSLSQELGICEAYLSVEGARFGDRLQVATKIDPRLDLETIQLPALSIQPLIENAIKHGIAPRASGGRVSIAVGLSDRAKGTKETEDPNDAVEIVIEDNGVGFGRSPAKSGAGVGLRNCRERLRLQYAESAGLSASLSIDALPEGGTRVVMTIPASGLQS